MTHKDKILVGYLGIVILAYMAFLYKIDRDGKKYREELMDNYYIDVTAMKMGRDE